MSANFVSTLRQMKDHYQSGAIEPFVIPEHAEHLSALGLTPHTAATAAGFAKLKSSPHFEVPKGIDAIRSDAKKAMEDHTGQWKSDAKDSTTQVQEDKDANSFKSRMMAQREKAKQDSNKTIDDAYAKAEALGENMSEEQQNGILASMNQLMSGVTNIISTVATAISSLIGSVMDIVNKVLDAVKSVEGAFAPLAPLLSFL